MGIYAGKDSTHKWTLRCMILEEIVTFSFLTWKVNIKKEKGLNEREYVCDVTGSQWIYYCLG